MPHLHTRRPYRYKADRKAGNPGFPVCFFIRKIRAAHSCDGTLATLPPNGIRQKKITTKRHRKFYEKLTLPDFSPASRPSPEALSPNSPAGRTNKSNDWKNESKDRKYRSKDPKTHQNTKKQEKCPMRNFSCLR